MASQLVECPFPDHDDSTPSFDLEKGYCFGCKRKVGGKTRGDDKSLPDSPEILKKSKQKTCTCLKEKPPALHKDLFRAFLKKYQITKEECERYEIALSLEHPGYAHFSDGQTTFLRNLCTCGAGRFLTVERGLFGINNLRDTGRVLIAEGVTDMLALQRLGYGCVATLTASLSEEHAYYLRKARPVFVYDNDYAGWKGAIAGLDTFRKMKVPAAMIELPEQFGKDCAEAYLNHREKFATFLEDYFHPKNSILDLPSFAVKTGIDRLDDKLSGGLRTGLTILTGQTSVGKSAFAVHVARTAGKAKRKTGIFTYEISVNQYWARLLSPEAGVEWRELERNHKKLVAAYEQSPLREYITVIAGSDLGAVLNSIEQYEVVIIDYIDLMPVKGTTGEHERTNEIVKAFARISDKVCLCLARLSREGKIANSGLAEYGCQALLKIVKAPHDNRIRVVIKKNTRGELGKIPCVVDLARNVWKGEL